MSDVNTTNPTSTTSSDPSQSRNTPDASNMNAPAPDVPPLVEGPSRRFYNIVVAYLMDTISNVIVTVARIFASDDTLRASFLNIRLPPQTITMNASAAANDNNQTAPAGEHTVDDIPLDADVNEGERAVDSYIPVSAPEDATASGSSDADAPPTADVQATSTMSTSISSVSSLTMANTSSSSSGSSRRSALRGSRPSGMRRGSMATFNEMTSGMLITPRIDTHELPDADASFRSNREFQQPLAPVSVSPTNRTGADRTPTTRDEEMPSHPTIYIEIPEAERPEALTLPAMTMVPLHGPHDGWYRQLESDLYIHENSFTSGSPLTPATSARPVRSDILECLRALNRRAVMLAAMRDADGWFKDGVSGLYINRTSFRDVLPPLPAVDTPVPPAPYAAPQSLPTVSTGRSTNAGLFATSRNRTPSALDSSEFPVDAHALSASPLNHSDTARPRPGAGQPSVYPMPPIRSITTAAAPSSDSDEASSDGDDDRWPWYPTQSATNHLMSFARPKEWTYPINQDVLFSHTHGMINLSAMKEESRIARRKQLKASLKTVLTLGLY